MLIGIAIAFFGFDVGGLKLGLAWSSPLHVVIDAGHGGNDSGAVRGRIREADMTLDVSRQLAKKLRKDARFKVTVTRSRDHYVGLQKRAAIATASTKNSPANVFISLHINSAPDRRAHGVEFYIQNQLPAAEEMMLQASLEEKNERTGSSQKPKWLKHPNAEVAGILEDIHKSYRISHSWQLARMMQKNWTITASKVRSIRQAPFYLLQNVYSPSVLVELGFLTNRRDLAKLKKTSNHRKIASDLHRALVDFKEVLDK